VFGEWVDEITTVISDTVRFRCTIHNNGTACPLSQIVATDLLPPSLEYRDNATVNGEPWEPTGVGPKEFVWDLGERVLRPSERIVIEFDAHVTECGTDINTQKVTAIGCDETVSASDTATVLVPCRPSIEVEKQVWREAEEVITPADIMFVFDATGSMGDEINEVKSSATNIMSDIRAVIADSRFGLASFADYPYYYESYCGYSNQYGSPSVPDWPYRLDQALTTDIVAVQGAIGGLTLGSGEDGPEDYTRVLWELGVNDVADVGWRPGATKIAIVFGDAPTHDCDFYATSTGGDPGPDAIAGTPDDLNFESVVAQLAANDVIVLSVDSSGYPGGDPEESFRYMAYKTGGAYYALPDAGEIPKAVLELVTSVFGEWVDEITTVISDTVRFRCTIHNDGEGCPLANIVASDLLPPSLEYRDNATVNGEPWEPTQIGPKEFEWDLGEWMLWPSERIVIEFDAHVTECGEDINTQEVTAIGCDERVSDSDIATVLVPCVERTRLYIDPASATTSISGTTTVDVRIRDVTDLYGVQLHLSFDPSIVQVEDAIAGGGVNIEPGDFLDPGAVVYTNDVNNTTGVIEYVQSRQGTVPGVDGSGLLARITFHGESAGTSDLDFTLHILSDPLSVPIPHDYADGEIVVSSAAGGVSGKVILERRVNYPNANAGVTVRLAGQSQVTGDDGTYSFSGVPAGTHQISATHPSYLPTWRNVSVTAGATTTLPDVTMLGGDCSPMQGIIDETDSAVMGQAWGTSPGDPDWEVRADVRDDGSINVLDYTAVQFNWLTSAPAPWTASGATAQEAPWAPRVLSFAPQAAAATTVVISPTVITTSIGAPATVEVWVQDVEDLYAGGFDIDFDPSVVRVQDANPFVDGVQVEPGSWLQRQLEAANSADNTAGQIKYSVTQSRPETGKDGSGILARITFVGKSEGSSMLQFSRLKLVDDELITISASAQDGQVVVAGGARIYLPVVMRSS
jgi:uncharacterized repeat protein (TIGR01451 family)